MKPYRRMFLNELLGKCANRDLNKGERMRLEYVGMKDGNVKCKM